MDINKYNGYVIHSNGIIHNTDNDFLNLVNFNGDTIYNQKIDQFIMDDYKESLQNKFQSVKSKNTTLGIQLKLKSGVEVIAISNLIGHKSKIQTYFINLSNKNLDVSLTENAINNAPIGVTIADITLPDEPLIYVNNGFTNLTGYSYDEIIGQNCRFLQGEDTNEKQVRRLRKAIYNREDVKVDLINYKKDGTKFWNRVTLKPIIQESGNVEKYIGFQQDISKSKIYKKEKNVFEKHAETSEQAMFVTDDEWNITYANPAFEDITQYTENEILGKRPDILQPNSVDSNIYCEIKDLLKNASIWKGELMNVKKSGELYQSKQIITAIKNDRDEITNYTIILEDITYDKLNQQVLTVLNRVLRHNLRTSINVISGYTDILDSNCSDLQKQKSIRKIRKRTQEMDDISQKMKKVRNLAIGDKQPTPLKINKLNEIIKPYRKRKNTIIRLDIESGGNREIKYGSIFKIALDEVISHAIEDNTKAVSRVHIIIKEIDENHIDVEIKDNQSSIKNEEWKIIQSGEETPLGHIDGIELWILYWSVTAIGGDIKLHSKKSNENTFTIKLPLK